MDTFFRIFLLAFIFALAVGCSQEKEADINQLINEGEFLQAETLLAKKIGESRNDSVQHKKYIIQLEILSRLRKEFPYSRSDVREQLKPYYPDVSDEQLDNWEAARQLEMRIIDGEKRYFSRAASNLFRLNHEAKKLKSLIF